MKKIISKTVYIFLLSNIFWACDKTETNPDKNKATFEMKITDARTVQTKSDSEVIVTTGDIIEPAKLTKFEVSISKIELKDKSGNYIEIMSSPTLVDLRQYRGTVKDLLSVEITSGIYKSIIISIDGVNITYDSNNYKANSSGASVTIGSLGYTVNSGIPNPFISEQAVEMPFEFEIADTTNLQGVRLFFDAEASCKEIAVDVPTLGTFYFAGIRENLFISAILENNIQQIMHSPPLDIKMTSEADFNYYGIHTFVDFAKIGGTINSHTSQHVFRGADGTLLIDAEDMAVNNAPLLPTTINANGETDVRADEVFKYINLKNNLAGKGYALESGKVYYFSLRKIWNITTDGKTYELTRLCEPIPVYCP